MHGSKMMGRHGSQSPDPGCTPWSPDNLTALTASTSSFSLLELLFTHLPSTPEVAISSPSSPPTYLSVSLSCEASDLSRILEWLSGRLSSSVLVEEGDPCRLVFVPPDTTSTEWLLIESALVSLGAVEIHIETTLQEDWQELWKEQGFKRFSVGRLSVIPAWDDNSEEPGGPEIRIDPHMAFGTGLHETTFRCLELLVGILEGFSGPAPAILDFGSGTGILGIAALKLSEKATLVAVDNDPYAVEATRENLLANGMEHRSMVFLSLEDWEAEYTPAPFTIIVANVTGGVIASQAGLLFDRLVPGGRMICSGSSREETARTEEALRKLPATLRTLPGERYDTFLLEKT